MIFVELVFEGFVFVEVVGFGGVDVSVSGEVLDFTDVLLSEPVGDDACPDLFSGYDFGLYLSDVSEQMSEGVLDFGAASSAEEELLSDVVIDGCFGSGLRLVDLLKECWSDVL